MWHGCGADVTWMWHGCGADVARMWRHEEVPLWFPVGVARRLSERAGGRCAGRRSGVYGSTGLRVYGSTGGYPPARLTASPPLWPPEPPSPSAPAAR
eukprot:1193184-Prorocentrum_minimum.AAC.1